MEFREPLVLIVDDTLVNRMVLETILRKEGFGTIVAQNGPDGRAAAIERHPDLIFLDIMMPEEDGFETCALLKKDSRTADIPIIFITALADTKNKVNGLTSGAVDYITKPFESAEVLARARIHIQIRHAHRLLIEEQKRRLMQLRDVQQSILVKPEDLPRASFSVFYKPLYEAGGDFYDVVRAGQDIYGYFVADIAGHDVGASFATSAIKALLKQNSGPLVTPFETLATMNEVMLSILPEGQHFTALYAHLNRGHSKLTVLSAGHPYLIYQGQNTEEIGGPGDVLGAFSTISMLTVVREVKKGDRLFLYTDGMIEKPLPARTSRQDGIAALMAACNQTRSVKLADAVARIAEIIYPENAPVDDDLLLLGVEV
jgi:phosphoserine phosphatase RsbU/P